MIKIAKSEKTEQPELEPVKDELPTVYVPSCKEGKREEFERLMRGSAYTRRRGAIRQTRHS
ncbi:hypothetical protein [Aneurinibacillus aneurinilyticus]|uniref:hypothetical protein n=1 Tax=Aneurinibacillus aneurinilyticus TaxID=1391 RepID=UPI003524EE6D